MNAKVELRVMQEIRIIPCAPVRPRAQGPKKGPLGPLAVQYRAHRGEIINTFQAFKLSTSNYQRISSILAKILVAWPTMVYGYACVGVNTAHVTCRDAGTYGQTLCKRTKEKESASHTTSPFFSKGSAPSRNSSDGLPETFKSLVGSSHGCFDTNKRLGSALNKLSTW